MSVAIIGAGLAGLAAAIEAADAGASAVVFDGREHPGGRARTRSEQGFSLNEGPHALYVDGEANRFLGGLGCEPAGGQPDTATGWGIDGELCGRFPSGLASVLRTPLLRGDRIRAVRLFAGLGRLDPSRYAAMTVAETVEALVGRGRAARLLDALFRLGTYGNDPTRTSGDAGLAQLQMSVAGGVRYLHGGWQTVVDSLVAEARNRGVEIRPGTKADAVRCDDGAATLTVDGVTMSFDGVVLAVGGPRNVGRLLGDRAPEAAEWARTARPATVAALDIGSSVPWGDGPTFALGIDEPLYLSVHAPVADLAPPGGSLVHVSRYLDPDEPDDPTRDRARCEAFADRVRPGWRDDAVHVGFRRRLVAAFDQPRPETGGLAGRPSVALPGLPGVYIAGDWVGPVGLLADASVASGRAAGAAVAAQSRAVVVR